MVPVRTKLQLGEGGVADLLVTPHLAVYEEWAGVPRTIAKDAGPVQVMERYADIMYLAALNAWELDGKGTREEYPHTRGDFHAVMQADPKEFTRAVKFVLTALTGKTERELVEEEKSRQNENESAKTGKDEGSDEKKKRRRWPFRTTGR